MPLYEYQCDACGHRFEKIQKYSDPPIDVCPKCGGKVQKLISSPAFQFKGTGWYVTDYAGKKTSEAGEKSSSSSGSSSSSTSGETKTESKSTETKSDSKPSSDTKS